MAEAGYIVVSVNTNRGINGLPGLVGDNGLVLARGRLLLKHLETLRGWATFGGAPASLGLGSNGLIGAIDFGEVAYVGHSRGGEGVRAAYNLYRDAGSPWPAKIPGLNVKAIAEISPTDRLSSRVLDATGVPWLGITAMCDLDWPQWSAHEVFARAMANMNESPAAVKALYSVWGADHNGYNTEWHFNDSEAFGGSCTGPQNWQINDPTAVTGRQTDSAVAGIMSLIQSSVGSNANPDYLQALDPLYSLPASVTQSTRVERTWSNAPSTRRVLDDFTNSTGLNSSGQVNRASNTSVTHTTAPPTLGQSSGQRGATIRWTAPGANTYFQMNWTPQSAGRDISDEQMFEFRIGRADLDRAAANPNFSIRLVNANGTLSDAVALNRYATVWPMAGAQRGGTAYDHPVLQTVRIPLSDFANADLTNLRGARFTFDDGPGHVLIANAGFSSGITFAGTSTPTGGGGGGSGGDSISLQAPYDDPEIAVAATAGLVDIRIQHAEPLPVTAELPTLTIGAHSTQLGGVLADPTMMVFRVDPAWLEPLPSGTTITVNVGGRVLTGALTNDPTAPGAVTPVS